MPTLSASSVHVIDLNKFGKIHTRNIFVGHLFRVLGRVTVGG